MLCAAHTMRLRPCCALVQARRDTVEEGSSEEEAELAQAMSGHEEGEGNPNILWLHTFQWGHGADWVSVPLPAPTTHPAATRAGTGSRHAPTLAHAEMDPSTASIAAYFQPGWLVVCGERMVHVDEQTRRSWPRSPSASSAEPAIAAGGNVIQLFDRVSGLWSTLPPPLSPRQFPVLLALGGHHLLLMGES
jgi:hypothetical protein